MAEELPLDSQGRIVVFGAKQIRRAWVEDQWYFSVVDIVGVLADSASPAKYWDAMKRRENEASGLDLSTLCRKVNVIGADGKTYKSEAVNTESAFRIIQSIPSPRASLSSSGSRTSAISEFRKSKTPNWRNSECASYTRKNGIR